MRLGIRSVKSLFLIQFGQRICFDCELLIKLMVLIDEFVQLIADIKHVLKFKYDNLCWDLIEIRFILLELQQDEFH